MLFYLPLESYKERYTILMSSRDGWIENLMNKNKIEFTRVEGLSLDDSNTIKSGSVLDACNRSYYSLTQIANMVQLLKKGIVKNDDIIYLDDFWTPGIEAIAYTAQLLNVRLHIYAMLHAQTVDKYDFTYKMKYWMRHYEIGQSNYMDGIFVTSEYLMDLCTEAGLKNIFFGGLPFNSKFIKNLYPVTQKKEKQIIFSSRFDIEKRPDFFIEIAKALHNSGYKFLMTSSFDTVHSNDSNVKKIILDAKEKDIIDLKVGISKKQYYEELQKSTYQINCALQDWLSWTMLEAITYECIPIYPQYRSFPEYLPSTYLYKWDSIDSAIKTIQSNTKFDSSLNNVVEYFDHSFERMLKVMRLI